MMHVDRGTGLVPAPLFLLFLNSSVATGQEDTTPALSYRTSSPDPPVASNPAHPLRGTPAGQVAFRTLRPRGLASQRYKLMGVVHTQAENSRPFVKHFSAEQPRRNLEGTTYKGRRK